MEEIKPPPRPAGIRFSCALGFGVKTRPQTTRRAPGGNRRNRRTVKARRILSPKSQVTKLDVRRFSAQLGRYTIMKDCFRRPSSWIAETVFALLSVIAAHAAPTSTSTVTASSTPTLRINEVLAWNTKIANGSTY